MDFSRDVRVDFEFIWRSVLNRPARVPQARNHGASARGAHALSGCGSGNARRAGGVWSSIPWRHGRMAKSPEKPTPVGGLETDSLPWQPSPGPLAAEDPAERFDHPQEAIGGGSHQPVDEAAPASRAPEAAEAATTAITEGLKD